MIFKHGDRVGQYEFIDWTNHAVIAKVGDLMTFGETPPIPDLLDGSNGFAIAGYAGSSALYLCSHCTTAKQKLKGVHFWRRLTERVYVPSIFAEPVPLP